MDEGFQGALGKVCSDEVRGVYMDRWGPIVRYAVDAGWTMGFMVFRYAMGGLEADSMVVGGRLDTSILARQLVSVFCNSYDFLPVQQGCRCCRKLNDS
jgi:hypothetical protein